MIIKKILLQLLILILGFSTILPLTISAKAESVNLISNPSVESADSSNSALPQGWLTGNWGTNSATFSYLNTGHNGSRSVQVNINSYSSGDAKWYFTPVTVVSNSQYTFSDYYQSNVTTEVVAQLEDSTGRYSYLDLGAVPASTSWQLDSKTFTTPSTTVRMTIFHLINSVGTLTVDDFALNAYSTFSVNVTNPTSNSSVSGVITLSAQVNSTSSIANVCFAIDNQYIGSALTTIPYQIVWDSTSVSNGSHVITATATANDGTSATSSPASFTVNNSAPSNGNLIPNPSLTNSNSSSTAPQDWISSSWGTNTVSFSYLKDGYQDSNSVQVQITSYSSGDAKWYFAPQTVQTGSLYFYSDYYKSNIQSQVVVAFNMSDGSTTYMTIGSPDAASSWTNFKTSFYVPIGATSLTIYHLIQKVGTLTTDDFTLAPYAPTGYSRALVSLTFDDGYANTYTYGQPELQKYGFKSTQFIVTSLVNTKGYMTKAQVKSLYTLGNEIGSHTVSHGDLTSLSSTNLVNELSKSKTTLQSWTGATITGLAYPYGSYNGSVISAVKQYYSYARSVEEGFNSKDNFNAYDIKVQNVFDSTTTDQIINWINQAIQTKTWLVLVYHSVGPVSSTKADGTYNITAAQLDAQFAAIKNSGITVETIQQALKEISAQ